MSVPTGFTTPHPSEFIQALKLRLRAIGASYTDLGKVSGYSVSQVSRWMNAVVEPRFTSVYRLEVGMQELERRREAGKPLRAAKHAPGK